MSEFARNISITDRFRNKNRASATQAENRSRGALDWHVGRGSWVETRNLREVVDGLPTFHNQNLLDIVSKLPNKATVWDLGSGDKASALSELVSEFPEQELHGVGVTLPVDRDNLVHPENVTVVRQDVNEFLRTFDKTERPDVIYMAKLLEWMPHPLSTIKLAYNALAPNGILFADDVPNMNPPMVNQDGRLARPSALGKLLDEADYDAEIHDGYEHNGIPLAYRLSIRKTDNHPQLHLPLSIITPDKLPDVEIGKGLNPYGTILEPNTQYAYKLKDRM